MREFLDTALNTATSNGASYADIRISRHKNQSIRTVKTGLMGFRIVKAMALGYVYL